MQVDLCVFLAGLYLEEYTPLFFETLFANCDISRLCIHVVEKGYIKYPEGVEKDPWGVNLELDYYFPISENVHNYLLKKQNESPVPFYIYKEHDPQLFFNKSGPGKPFFQYSHDHSETLNWAISNCGTNKWVIFSHSDMVFRDDIQKDIITRLIEGMHDWVGIWGCYSHCFAVNREAYFKTEVNFNAASGFCAVNVKEKHKGFGYEIRHGSDPLCPPNAELMYGWDVAELLRLIMTSNGWECDLSQVNQDLNNCVDHMSSGHGYVNDDVAESQKQRRRNWLKHYRVQRL